jgi:cobalamin synthase
MTFFFQINEMKRIELLKDAEKGTTGKIFAVLCRVVNFFLRMLPSKKNNQ